MNPPPANNDIARDQYRGEAGRAYHEEKRALPPLATPWVARARAKLFQSHVRSSDTVFEYGCGYGWNLLALNCARRIGYDPAEVVQESLRAANIESVPSPESIPDVSCDLVISHHSLEHVGDPLAALREMRRVLKPQGKFLLSVPYETGRKYSAYDPTEPNHHLFSWNVQTLGNLVSLGGFQVIDARLRKYGYDRFAARRAVRLRIGERGFLFIRRLGWTFRPLHEVTLVAAVR